MSNPLVAREPVRDEAWFAARMTRVQFQALAAHLDPRRVEADCRGLLDRRRPRRSRSCNVAEVARWLINGWSTEQILLTNSEHLSGDALRHSLHWAFPQTYYSAFAVTVAYFKAAGFTESSHTSVIRKFGNEAASSRYPTAISFTASGARDKTFTALTATALPTSVAFSSTDSELVEGQIAQFLRATRALDLREKKKEIRIPTARGGRKRAFGAADWARVDSALGVTSLLSLLYRKRIKANYRDIDSFLHEEIDAPEVYRCLLRIVGALNFTHELFLGCMLSCDQLEEIIAGMPEGTRGRPSSRSPHIRRLAA